jgi:serine/threonine protein kinase
MRADGALRIRECAVAVGSRIKNAPVGATLAPVKSGDLVGGRFRLEAEVGSGGTGTVHRATDEQTGELVAVKLLAVQDTLDVARARREAQALAQLSHPAIVRYIESGEQGELFLAMQWIDGVTVGDRLSTTGFTLRETIAMVRRVAEALAAAHAVKIVHRDVKPSNVLLPRGQAAQAMLIDFGIARPADDRTLTRTGIALGTPGYMAPEQARGDRELTPAVDVFSLGCLLYECATGRPAFSGTMRAAVLTKILFGHPEPFEALCSEAPRRLADLVERMLDKVPHARLASAADVVTAIDALGPIPDGPRRDSRSYDHEPTQRTSPAQNFAHCLVLASHGNPDETLDGPDPAGLARLHAELATWQATPVALRTGGIVIHLADAPAAMARRAAWCALATKRVFADWTVVITAIEAEVSGAAEHGTRLLSSAAVAMIFRKLATTGVVIDPTLAPLLEAEFELDLDGTPRLLGPSQ